MTATVSIARFSLVLFTFAVYSVSARKCYVCSSQQNPGCNDANQISQLYQDCSQSGGFGGGYNQGGQFGQQGQQGGQFGQQGGSFGGGYGGGDRCYKVMIVNAGGPSGGGGYPNQPTVIRGCGQPQIGMGNQPGMGGGMVGSDGCSWNGNIMTCSCDWNYCNGSTRVATTSLFSLLAIAVIASLFSFSSRKL